MHCNILNNLNNTYQKVPYKLGIKNPIYEFPPLVITIDNLKNEYYQYYMPKINKFYIGNEPYGYCKYTGNYIDVMTLPNTEVIFGDGDNFLLVFIYLPLYKILDNNNTIVEETFDLNKVNGLDVSTGSLYNYFVSDASLISKINITFYQNKILENIEHGWYYVTNDINMFHTKIEQYSFKKLNLNEKNVAITIHRNNLNAL